MGERNLFDVILRAGPNRTVASGGVPPGDLSSKGLQKPTPTIR
jgi:hypothetical protein